MTYWNDEAQPFFVDKAQPIGMTRLLSTSLGDYLVYILL